MRAAETVSRQKTLGLSAAAHASLLAPLALTAAVACSSDRAQGGPAERDVDVRADESDPKSPHSSEMPPDVRLAVGINPSNALSFFADWRTSRPTATWIEVRCDDPPGAASPFGTRVYEDAAKKTDHAVFVMGLVDGAECAVTVRASDDEGSAEHATSIRAGPLPDSLVALEITTESRADGWTLFNLNSEFDPSARLLLVAVDGDGRYRWYSELSPNHSTTDVRVVPEGLLVGGSQLTPMRIVDWTGQTVWRSDRVMHHDLRPDGTTDRLLFVGWDHDCDGYIADTINVLDRNAGDVLWTWRFCDHYTPPDPVDDWSHVNTVVRMDDGASLLVSSRDQHALFKVDRATGDVLWKLGRDGDFDLPEEDHFYRQHAPELLEDGNILLFDNGWTPRPWSRALELEIDEAQMTAHAVWEYVPPPTELGPVFTPIWGDADRLPSGNTLVAFGHRSEISRSRIIEVTPAGDEIWHLVLPPARGFYRAERMAPIWLMPTPEP